MMRGRNRRDFIKQCCVLGAASAASAHIGRLGLAANLAAQTNPFKALVCVFLFGGNDANNMIVPIDSTRYNLYRSMRGAVALDRAAVEARSLGASGYGLHPSLANMRQLYNQGLGAAVFNVGTLVRPTTKADLLNGNAQLPRNLYSHSDQTQQWQSSDPIGGTTGWGGRANDIVAAMNTGTLAPGITVSGGNSLFLSGPNTQGMNVANLDSFGLEYFGDGSAMSARIGSLQRLLTFDSGIKLVGAANGVLDGAVRTAQEVNAILSSSPTPPVPFPNSSLGRQLEQATRLLSVQSQLGMSRQLFFAGMGGFDNHEDLLTNHATLMQTLDASIGAFFQNLEQMGLANSVTLFTESEFSRTGDANSNVGTDHAWGSHHMVFGGAVVEGTYGTFPTHQLRGPDDAGDRGYWIPTTALDQYAATLAAWYGVPTASLPSVFPNLANWSADKHTLGFLA